MKKLLGREPTPEMVCVALDRYWKTHDVAELIRAMWDAAPALPEPGEVEGLMRSAAQTLVEAGLGPIADSCNEAADLIASLRSDRDAKTTRMWELGKKCDELEDDNERLREATLKYRAAIDGIYNSGEIGRELVVENFGTLHPDIDAARKP